MIITISGLPGSGKSTVAKLLSKKLGYRHYSGGDMRGKIAMKHGMTIDELNEIGKTEFWTDKEVDELIKEKGEKEDDFVIDSWIAFHFIPRSKKIFLEVDPRAGAERVFSDQRPDEPTKETVEEVQEMLRKRLENTDSRYKKYYKVDFLDRKNYDLVIDTTNITAEQVADKVLEFLGKKV